MKNKLIKSIMLCLNFLIILSFNKMIIQASSGELRSDSICQGANSIYYGQHSDDNHWHVAVHHDSGWYPNGEAIYSNPCKISSNQVEQESEGVSLNSVPKITSTTTVSLDEGQLNFDLAKDDIIDLFEIEVLDEGQRIPNNKIEVNPSNISKDFIGTQEINIYYEDSQGLSASENVKLIVNKEDNKPQIITNLQQNEVLKIKSTKIPQNIEELVGDIDLKIIDEEDGNIPVDKSNISIDQENEVLIITAKDTAGNIVNQSFDYNIIEQKDNDLIIMIIILIILIIIGFIIIKRKLRNNKILMEYRK